MNFSQEIDKLTLREQQLFYGWADRVTQRIAAHKRKKRIMLAERKVEHENRHDIY